MTNNVTPHSISIIIPVLNEEHGIGKLLEYLISNSSPENISEIIVVDGGSTDATKKVVHAFSSFSRIENKKAHHYIDYSNIQLEPFSNPTTTSINLLESEKGRAKQMNLGAKSASGNILYFLHADSFPPKSFDKLIINEVKKEHEAGCFKMKFNSNHWWLKLAGWLTQFPWEFARGGDQSQFITKSLFNNIGGFDERYTIYEDNDLISKLYKRKKFIVIQKEWLTTSPRRYATKGVWRLQYHYWCIHIKKWLGADAKTLNKYYHKHVYIKKQ